MLKHNYKIKYRCFHAISLRAKPMLIRILLLVLRKQMLLENKGEILELAAKTTSAGITGLYSLRLSTMKKVTLKM